MDITTKGRSDLAPILQVQRLSRHFGGVVALDNVDFTVDAGEIFSVIGPNGAGKTTLFNCISGVYKPTSGAVRFEGVRVSGHPPHRIAARGIARTFQNIELFTQVTTMENLLLGRHLKMRAGLLGGATMFLRRSQAAVEEVEHREFVEHIIDRLDLHPVRDRFVSELPYGIRKKVELGRALATEPRLLLLDEPSAGMNQEEREDLIYTIQDLRAELGITVLLIEHHMQMVQTISDRVLAINFGRPITQGSPPQVATHPEVIQAYLGAEEENS